MSTLKRHSLSRWLSSTFHTHSSDVVSSLIITICAFVGWSLRLMTIGYGAEITTYSLALLAQSALVVVIFAAIGWLYGACSGAVSPPNAAMAMLGAVVGFDFFLIAILVNQDLAIYAHPLATWIPYALMGLSAWLGGECARGTAEGV